MLILRVNLWAIGAFWSPRGRKGAILGLFLPEIIQKAPKFFALNVKMKKTAYFGDVALDLDPPTIVTLSRTI
jgi:hypothetical protein